MTAYRLLPRPWWTGVVVGIVSLSVLTSFSDAIDVRIPQPLAKFTCLIGTHTHVVFTAAVTRGTPSVSIESWKSVPNRVTLDGSSCVLHHPVLPDELDNADEDGSRFSVVFPSAATGTVHWKLGSREVSIALPQHGRYCTPHEQSTSMRIPTHRSLDFSQRAVCPDATPQKPAGRFLHFDLPNPSSNPAEPPRSFDSTVPVEWTVDILYRDAGNAMVPRLTLLVHRAVPDTFGMLMIGGPLPVTALQENALGSLSIGCLSHTIDRARWTDTGYPEPNGLTGPFTGFDPTRDSPAERLFAVTAWIVNDTARSTAIVVEMNLEYGRRSCSSAMTIRQGSPASDSRPITEADFSVSLLSWLPQGAAWSTHRLHFGTRPSSSLAVASGSTGYMDSKTARIEPRSCDLPDTTQSPIRGTELRVTVLTRFRQLVTGQVGPSGTSSSAPLTMTGIAFVNTSSTGTVFPPVSVEGSSSNQWRLSTVTPTVCGTYRGASFCEFAITVVTACKPLEKDGASFLDADLATDSVTIRAVPLTCDRNMVPAPDALPTYESGALHTWMSDFFRSGYTTHPQWCVQDAPLVIKVTHGMRVYTDEPIDLGQPLEVILSRTPHAWEPVSQTTNGDAWTKRSYVTVAVRATHTWENYVARIRIDPDTVEMKLSNGAVLRGLAAKSQRIQSDQPNVGFASALRWGPKALYDMDTKRAPDTVQWCLHTCACDMFALHRRTLDSVVWKETAHPHPSTTTAAAQGEPEEQLHTLRSTLLPDDGVNLFFAEWARTWKGEVQTTYGPAHADTSHPLRLTHRRGSMAEASSVRPIVTGSAANPDMVLGVASVHAKQSSSHLYQTRARAILSSLGLDVKDTEDSPRGHRRNRSHPATPLAAGATSDTRLKTVHVADTAVLLSFTVHIDVYNKVAMDVSCLPDPATPLRNAPVYSYAADGTIPFVSEEQSGRDVAWTHSIASAETSRAFGVVDVRQGPDHTPKLHTSAWIMRLIFLLVVVVVTCLVPEWMRRVKTHRRPKYY